MSTEFQVRRLSVRHGLRLSKSRKRNPYTDRAHVAADPVSASAWWPPNGAA